MLSDHKATLHAVGGLRADLHLSEEWRDSLIRFIAGTLPEWRDDQFRQARTAETALTSQLCAWLNSATRTNRGWDILQFRTEEPDETRAGRTIDLVAAPLDGCIWIQERRYSRYEPLLPVECKRLPTPVGRERDEREYLHSRFGSRGGVQRFKAGDHGAAHKQAALIAYLQSDDIPTWHARIEAWTEALSSELADWDAGDRIHLAAHDSERGLGRLASVHRREGLSPLALDHLWVLM